MNRESVWGRLAMLSQARHREPPHGYDFSQNVLQVDTDAICPRCMGWIAPHAILRRTGFGLLQHEACPAAGAETTMTSDHA